MKNLKNLAAFVATAALATAAMAQNVDNWRNSTGDVWKNSTGDCWRDANWTPATAAVGCDGAIVAPKAAPAAAPASPPPAAPARPARFGGRGLGASSPRPRWLKGGAAGPPGCLRRPPSKRPPPPCRDDPPPCSPCGPAATSAAPGLGHRRRRWTCDHRRQLGRWGPGLQPGRCSPTFFVAFYALGRIKSRF